jgi:hypothetical protein
MWTRNEVQLIQSWYRPEEVTSALDANGFVDIRVTDRRGSRLQLSDVNKAFFLGLQMTYSQRKAADEERLAMPPKTIEAELRVLEERLAMPAPSESRETLGALLAPEFREFGSSGRIYEATSTLDALIPGERPHVMLEDFKAASLTEDAVLVTYLSRSVTGPGWKPPALRSSLWIRRASGWQIVFHQGTRLPADEA